MIGPTGAVRVMVATRLLTTTGSIGPEPEINWVVACGSGKVGRVHPKLANELWRKPQKRQALSSLRRLR